MRRVIPAALACWALIAAAYATRAGAQPRFSLRAEVGGGGMLSSYQRDVLGFDRLSYSAAIRIGQSILPPLMVQAGLEHWLFPSDGDSGAQAAVTGGLRLAPQLGALGVVFADANLGAGFTGEVTRLMFDAAVGAEFRISGALHAGPFVRYGQTVAADDDAPYDARYLTGGVTIALHTQPRAAAADDDILPDAPDPPIVVERPPPPDPQPPADSDGDGIADADDACPEESAGATPDPARAGCPIADRDGDSVSDAEDACPDQRGDAAEGPRRGCPALAQVGDDTIELSEPFRFASDSATILPESEALLDAAAELLRSRPELRLAIEGHTDATGSAAHNLALSRRRAQAVRQALVRRGIAGNRLTAAGFGAERPIVQGDTPDVHAQNRRVELRIVGGGEE